MRGGTILVVEPNPGILIVARNVLSRAGLRVVAAPNIKEGLELATKHDIDAVLVDAQLADPKSMAALHARRRVPVILTFSTRQANGRRQRH